MPFEINLPLAISRLRPQTLIEVARWLDLFYARKGYRLWLAVPYHSSGSLHGTLRETWADNSFAASHALLSV